MTLFAKAVEAVMAAEIDLDGATLKPKDAHDLVRAALMAVREPSHAVLKSAIWSIDDSYDIGFCEMEVSFTALVDAILNQSDGTGQEFGGPSLTGV